MCLLFNNVINNFYYRIWCYCWIDIFIYDNYPGGVGFSDKLFELHDELFVIAGQLIEGCGCESGCPSCVGPAGEFSDSGSPRDDTLSIIRYILGKSGGFLV